LKGIEKNYRADLWFFASGAKREMDNNKGYYEFLVNEYPEEFPSPYLAQIELVNILVYINIILKLINV